LTRTVTIVALTCLLVVGLAAASILGRDSLPAAQLQVATSIGKSPVANRASKQDRLAVGAAPSWSSAEMPKAADLNETLRQAFASAEAVPIEAPRAASAMVPEPAKPKLESKGELKPVSRPTVQKTYSLLSDAQIAGIKERLRLSSDQEYYWPAVEAALRALARRIHEIRLNDPHAKGVPIDPDAAEVQQLKSAAMPLLFQLREDQKQEVRALARLIGLEKVAAQI
jgi:hypothetical protein